MLCNTETSIDSAADVFTPQAFINCAESECAERNAKYYAEYYAGRKSIFPISSYNSTALYPTFPSSPYAPLNLPSYGTPTLPPRLSPSAMPRPEFAMQRSLKTSGQQEKQGWWLILISQ
jgi:hypothetical protein